MKVSAKELRTRTKDILDTVSRGESVTITYRGRARAKLVPIKEQERNHEKEITKQPLFGIWKDYDSVSNVESFIDKLRASRV